MCPDHVRRHTHFLFENGSFVGFTEKSEAYGERAARCWFFKGAILKKMGISLKENALCVKHFLKGAILKKILVAILLSRP